MVHLKNLAVSYFKNYELSNFSFGDSRVIGICGPNGVGKTNLLDAIYLSCLTKSYFHSTDMVNFRSPVDGFRIEAHFEKDQQPAEIVFIQREKGKKEISLNGVPLAKRTELIGHLPVVMVAPDDIEIINGSGEVRRKFIDAIISQIDTVYLEKLIVYNKLMQQRNSLLKQMAENKLTDNTLIEVINDQLTSPADIIHQKRAHYLSQLLIAAINNYHQISGEKEKISIIYQSQLQGTGMLQLLQDRQSKDRLLQRTTGGIHRDDLIIQLDDHSFKSIASQGQKKTMLFSFKLAEYEILKKNLNTSPLLLMDDVFEKLDANRMSKLLETVYHQHQAQVMITDTHRERLEKMFHELSLAGKILSLNFE